MSIPTKVYVGDKIVWPSGEVEIIIETKDDGSSWRVVIGTQTDSEDVFWKHYHYAGCGCKYIPNESLNVQRILEQYER